MNSPVLRKLATALVAVLLLFYIGYQLYNANYASVKTEVAEYVSADDHDKNLLWILKSSITDD